MLGWGRRQENVTVFFFSFSLLSGFSDFFFLLFVENM